MKRRLGLLFRHSSLVAIACLLMESGAWAQIRLDESGVVGRTIAAINYRYRSGATKVDFQGTELLPDARGEAKVESKRGYQEIEVEFRNLEPARIFGTEYLTYVLWAVSTQGRAENLGEILLDRDRGKINVTTQLQAFGMIVTAEPYFSVVEPSDVVVLENAVRPDTRGTVDQVDARYELLSRGEYDTEERPDPLTALLLVVDPKVSLHLYQARNSVRIARTSGAETHAPDVFQRAMDLLLSAESQQARQRPDTREVTSIARQAVQTAEDARLLAVRRIAEERLEEERRAAAERESDARSEAEAQAALRAAADENLAEAERLRAEAETLRAAAEDQRQRAEEAAAAAARARQEALEQRNAAEQEAARAREATAEAERQAAEADRLRAMAEQERAEVRQRLEFQLNRVLETTNTARGLIVNMSDVLFDSGQYTLKTATREILARISGILSMQQDLRIEVEGHTDDVGTDEFNQTLSEQRAGSVRAYLMEQGIDQNAITARGFGESRPRADNGTAAGRQQNRRVELIVSGGALDSVAETD